MKPYETSILSRTFPLFLGELMGVFRPAGTSWMARKAKRSSATYSAAKATGMLLGVMPAFFFGNGWVMVDLWHFRLIGRMIYLCLIVGFTYEPIWCNIINSYGLFFLVCSWFTHVFLMVYFRYGLVVALWNRMMMGKCVNLTGWWCHMSYTLQTAQIQHFGCRGIEYLGGRAPRKHLSAIGAQFFSSSTGRPSTTVTMSQTF